MHSEGTPIIPIFTDNSALSRYRVFAITFPIDLFYFCPYFNPRLQVGNFSERFVDAVAKFMSHYLRLLITDPLLLCPL